MPSASTCRHAPMLRSVLLALRGAPELVSLKERHVVQESMPKDTTNITSLHNVHKDCYHKVRVLCTRCHVE